jgi:tryptophan synthase alpha chain
MASASATTSPDALDRRFADLRTARRRALVVYITAGHPGVGQSLELLRGLDDAGADVIEVGVPFSDPMADGVVIQASSQRALELGMTLDKTLDLVAQARVHAPVVLFSYLNPLLASREDLLERSAEAGVHGVLVTDLPVGADPELEAWLGSGPLAFVRLVAPTTPRNRMAEIARHGRGFVYLISRLGVTGERADVSSDLPGTVAALREATSLPICVGFGISRPDQAATIGRLADGVVVGSAVVRAADRDVGAALSLVRAMRTSLDELP